MSLRSYEVWLGEVLVGWLAEESDGRIGFRFAESYRARSLRPVLSQSFEDDLLRTYRGKRPGQLPGFFAHLLPEGRLRSLLEASLGLPWNDDLGLLAAVGVDLPGAVSLRQSAELQVETASGTEAADEEDQEEQERAGLRFSLAGVQLKFSMLRGDGRFTLPAHDQRGDWIVKVGATEYPGLAENEYAMLEWARHVGFEVPECLLIGSEQLAAVRAHIPEGTRALAIRRYDRDSGRRLHQEDFAQVIGSSPQRADHKYDSTYDLLVVVVRALLGNEGYQELLRRIAFVVAIGNADAHLKNWSLLYRDGTTPSLAPLYDQVSTIAWPKLDRHLALKLAGARDFGRVSGDSFRRLARKAQTDPEQAADVARRTVAALREAWSQLAADTVLPEAHRVALREHWRGVPLLREVGELP